MRTGIFISQIESDGKISIPLEISDRLNLIEGEKVEILLKKIPNSKIKKIENVDHVLHFEIPGIFNKIVIDFLLKKRKLLFKNIKI